MFALAAALGLAALAQPADTLMYLPLDGNVRPLRGQGPVQVKGPLAFQPGLVGQALLCGEGGAQLQISRQGNVNPASGAVAMWIKPLDWNPDDGRFHVFFEGKGPGWIVLYKYYSGPPRILLLLSDDRKQHGWQYISGDIADWEPGQWHHLAACWDRRQARLYLDGKRVARIDLPPVPDVDAQTFSLGDAPWHIKRQAKSLIDEVYLFGRPLTDEEVATLYHAGKKGRPAPDRLGSPPPLRVFLIPQGWRNKYIALADLSGLGPAQRVKTRLHGKLLAPDGKARWEGVVGPLAGHLARIDLPLEFKPAGKWTFAVTAMLQGKQVARASDSFEMPDTSWMGNDLYEKLELLPPWTPLAVKGPSVTVWGREQTLSPFGYSSLSALGHALLSAPCRLEALLDGKSLTSASGQIRLVRHDDARATYEARAALGPLRWQARITVEFDGMVRVDGKLVGDEAVKVQALRLVVPFRSSQATLMHFAGLKWGECHARAIPQGQGQVWKHDEFLPFVWLGNEDCGAMWFSESTRGWHIAEGKPPLYVRRVGERTELVIQPISNELTLTSPWSWTYGLMATPVKPLPENWRRYRWEPGVRANLSIVWPHPTLQRYFGYPALPANDAKFRNLVEQKHKAGIMVVPYSCLTFLSEQAPEWKLFSDRWWVTGIADRTASDVKQFGAAFMAVCPRAEGWSDFVVWANQKYMRAYQLDGLYHDNTFPYPCSNRSHGCGWLDDKGTPHKVFPIFAHRRLYRRVYAMMKSLGRPTYMVSHMSGRVMMPVLSFTDAYLDGEQFRAGGHHVTDYRDVLTLDYFRGEFMGKQWGLMPVFLPELAAKARKRLPTRRLLAFTLLHDTPVWALWCDRKAVDELRQPLDAFDYVHADFVPYWHEPVETGDAEVKASAYVRDGRALLIVSNFAHGKRTVTLRLRRAALKLPQGRLVATDAESGKALQAEGDSVRVTLPDGDLRLILLSAGK